MVCTAEPQGSCREQPLRSSAGATLPPCGTPAGRCLKSLAPCSLVSSSLVSSPSLAFSIQNRLSLVPHYTSNLQSDPMVLAPFFVSNLHVAGSQSSFLLKEPSSLAPLPRFKVKTTIQQAESTIHPEHYSQTQSHDTSVPASKLLRIF